VSWTNKLASGEAVLGDDVQLVIKVELDKQA
jgi:hypothetical protein